MNFKSPLAKASFCFFLIFFLSSAIILRIPIESIGMDMSGKVLNKGKYVAMVAEVFYKKSGGVMVTKFSKPAETITITNANGELKIYDVKSNTVMQMHGLDYSSENSFFYYFLAGKSQDMGLKASGFKLQNTKISDGLVITNWVPDKNATSGLSKIELVHEKYKPIYMALYNHQKTIIKKTYYTNYKQVQDVTLPFNITEFNYDNKGDSTINRRLYSNVKVNDEVNKTYLNYQIPGNAKVLAPKK